MPAEPGRLARRFGGTGFVIVKLGIVAAVTWLGNVLGQIFFAGADAGGVVVEEAGVLEELESMLLLEALRESVR